MLWPGAILPLLAAASASAQLSPVCVSKQRWVDGKLVQVPCADEAPARTPDGRPGGVRGRFWTIHDWKAERVQKLTLPIVASKAYSEVTEHVRDEDPPEVRRPVAAVLPRGAARLRELTEGMKAFERRAHGLNDHHEQGACLAQRSRAAADALKRYALGDAGWRGFVVPWGLEESSDGAVCVADAPMRLDGPLLSAHAAYLREALPLLMELEARTAAARSDVLAFLASAPKAEPAAPQRRPAKRKSDLRARARELAQAAGLNEAAREAPAALLAAAGTAAAESARSAEPALGGRRADPASVSAAAEELASIRTQLIALGGDAPPVAARVPGPGDPWVAIPRQAVSAYRDAAAAAKRGDAEGALAPALVAVQTAPAWAEARWGFSLAKEAAATGRRPDPQALRDAADLYEGYAQTAWPDDGRREVALKRAQELRSLAGDIARPPIRVTRQRTVVSRTYRRVPLGRPRLFWDAAGGSFGGGFSELHALRVAYFPRSWGAAGAGFTAVARYRTPFAVAVAGGRERAVVDALLPVEVVWSPLNLRFWKNTTLSPMLFASYAPLARFHTATLKGSLKAGPVFEGGLRMPCGALAGLRASWVRMSVPDAVASGSNPPYRGFAQSRFYVALDLFLGAMLAEPKVR